MSVLVAFLAFTACASSSQSVGRSVPMSPAVPATVRIQMTERGKARIVNLPLEDYVLGAVLAEVDLEAVEDQAARRMLEVQSLVARTYAIANLGRHRRQGFDLCATTHCQIYRPADAWRRWVKPGREVVASTRGALLLSGGGARPLRALFHANCGGHTSAADEVWAGEAVGYLQARADTFCQRETPSRWNWTVAVAQLSAAVERREKTTLTRASRIDVVERDHGGRARRIHLGRPAYEMTGTDLRGIALATFGARSLRSTRFTVRETGGTFVFEGTGHGHGVGLCQAGALARARAGHSVQAIVEHYFPGARIVVARQARLSWRDEDGRLAIGFSRGFASGDRD